MKKAVIVAGVLVTGAGVFLWLGNVVGFYPTFPFAGYLTILAGVGIYKAGSKIATAT
jgi:hypothetical protein